MIARTVAVPPEAPRPVLRVGALVLDRRRVRVTLGGAAVALTRTEFLLLAALMARAGESVPRRVLAAAAWDEQPAAQGHAVEAHLSRLRVKLRRAAAAAGAAPPSIEAVRGLGYRLVAPPAD